MRKTNYPDYEIKPRHLDELETLHPGLVFYRLFDYCHLVSLRQRLWEWLESTVTGSFNSEETDPQFRQQLTGLYVQLQKLLEAAHILHLQQKEAMRQLDRIEPGNEND